MTVALVLVAKAPAPGRSKTRLCPPCTPAQAARVAEGALRDTLTAMAWVRGVRRIVSLDGMPGPWLPRGFAMVPQRGGGLNERLAAVCRQVPGPLLLIGMDTPQVSPLLLAHAARLVDRPGVDAVLGPAYDGGWWIAGMRAPGPEAFLGVPMSEPHTARAQLRRFDQLGFRTAELPPLRDVDTFADALEVASLVPGSRFAREVEAVTAGFGSSPSREPVLAAIAGGAS